MAGKIVENGELRANSVRAESPSLPPKIGLEFGSYEIRYKVSLDPKVRVHLPQALGSAAF